MTEIHPDLTETTVDGAGSRLWSLTRDDCPELAVHRIMHLGLADVAAPYRRVRLRPTGSFVMVGHDGRGRILLDGRWQTSRAGVACLAPPRVLNAFHAVPGSRWRFAWIRYDEPEHVRPLVSAASPVRVRCDADALWRILSGLRAEWDGGREQRLIHHWIELTHGEARRIAQPWHVNDRLWEVWDEVTHDLAAGWTLEKLAARYHASKEQFRRVCLRELGRSPMQHLTSLRIEQAQHLLSSTADKVETIAQQVGFENASVFSRAFSRWVGCSPKAYRE
jgi:AraC-like DNA-binding protein